MTTAQIFIGAIAGFVAGVLSGAFGVGGGIITTPVIAVLLGGTPIQAIATPLPVIFPTAAVGATNYHRAGQVSYRAVRWAVGPGIVGVIIGAALTRVINAHTLLLVTAVLLAWQAYRVIRGGTTAERSHDTARGWQYGIAGFFAGFVSGLLGIGGGIIFVPMLTVFLGMPLKRALGTSLIAITALVIPGTILHAAYGHIDWAIAAVLVIGVVPGAWLGSKLALGAQERALRIAVGSFLMIIAILYGALELARLVGWTS